MGLAGLKETLTFFAIPLEHLEPETVLGFDLFLRHGSSDPVLYRSADLPFTNDVRERLVGNGVRHVFVPSEQAPQYYAYRKAHPTGDEPPAREGPQASPIELEIHDVLADPSLPLRSRANALVGVSRNVVQIALADLGTPGLSERVQRVAEATARFLINEPGAYGSILSLLSEDSDAYHHATRTALYATELARAAQLGDLAHVAEVGRAALLHDVGRGDLPLEWLHKSGGGLGDLEWAEVVSHTTRGQDLLRQNGFGDPVCLDVCAHHHERCDGSGYPQGLKREQISHVSRLVAIVDIFDSLTSAGKHHVALSGFQALWRMKHGHVGQFDPELLDIFIRTMVEPGRVR